MVNRAIKPYLEEIHALRLSLVTNEEKQNESWYFWCLFNNLFNFKFAVIQYIIMCIIKICSEIWTLMLSNYNFYSMSSKAEYLKKYLEPTAEKTKKKKKKRKGQN